MKKVLLGLFALSAVSMAQNYFEGTNLYLKVGTDIVGEYDELEYSGVKFNEKDADGMGYELAVEFTKNVAPNFELGFGLAYQDHNEPKDKVYTGIAKISMPGYTSIPLYVTGKYNFVTESNVKPYIKTDLGYSFNDIDGDLKLTDLSDNSTETGSGKVENGLYFGFGAGLEYNNFVTELMYKINTAEIKDDEGDKYDYDYSRITLSFGYKFNF